MTNGSGVPSEMRGPGGREIEMTARAVTVRNNVPPLPAPKAESPIAVAGKH